MGIFKELFVVLLLVVCALLVICSYGFIGNNDNNNEASYAARISSCNNCSRRSTTLPLLIGNRVRTPIISESGTRSAARRTLDGSSRWFGIMEPIRQVQVQYWGGPKFSMEDGVYHCPGLNTSVRYTSEKGHHVMNKSHVVILYHKGNWDPTNITRTRKKDQILVYWSMESPKHSGKSNDLSFFNWTMTYRHDSEVPIPYGRLTPYNSSRNIAGLEPKLKTNWAAGKTKLALWVASNCNGPSWPRSSFVKTLQRYMDIDTFGRCGKKPNRICKSCVGKLDMYKFYLSFENDQCEEYITEKVWRNGFAHGRVPVVFGASRADFEKVVPKDSFIHVSDFANVSSLAEYIKKVDKNDTLYGEFFEWRKSVYVEDLFEFQHLDEEKLCALVGRYQRLSTENYVDKTEWFRSSCHKIPLPSE